MTEGRRIAAELIKRLNFIKNSQLTPVPVEIEFEEWQEILRIMIAGFEAAATLARPACVVDVNQDDLEREMNEGFEYFRRYFHWL